MWYNYPTNLIFLHIVPRERSVLTKRPYIKEKKTYLIPTYSFLIPRIRGSRKEEDGISGIR
jgi:hypothetical protein